MSRNFEYDRRDLKERDREQSEPASRMKLSRGRAGSSAQQESVPPEFDLKLLRRRIDTAAEGGPTLDEFLNRLEKSDIRVIPSVQSNGRWNGISYEFGGCPRQRFGAGPGIYGRGALPQEGGKLRLDT
jgi:hypothetical protein